MGSTTRTVFKVLAAIVASAAAITDSAPVEASGGIGWVAQGGIDATSITINWGLGSRFDPVGNFPYTICWKTSGDLDGACSGGATDTTDQTSYTITGLNPNEKYKIKVICRCEKNHKNANDRKVGTLTVTTPSVGPGSGSPLVVTGVRPDGFDVKYMYSHLPRRDLRLVYKMAWSPRFLQNKCSADKAEEGASDKTSGSYALPATWGDFRTIVPLQPHTRYKVALCDTTFDILVAEVRINTARQ